ncbi:hypothetical protein [Sediminitomix flava]|uniref:Tetratricopeptide repeat protein n=1 Tax=Sediminitomix flava TaxID=379075 RepID=A0A315Z839_SEDFL|nr:hypothetical protein [Sediminitomix flava]PWJ40828.1 hypothetical protein BC781_10487 [Sediminitomix flava]
MEKKNFSQSFFTPETSLEEIETRIYLEYKTRELTAIRQRMLSNKKRRLYTRVSSVAASLLIFFMFSYANLNVSPSSIALQKADKYSYLYRNSSVNEKQNIPIQDAIALIQKSDFKSAISLLEKQKQEQFSDHYDWYLGLAYLGDGKMEKAQQLFNYIESQSNHLYHNEITTYFNFQLFVLEVTK